MVEIPVPPTGERNVPMLVLSYLGILALIPLLAEPNDPEVQRHAKYGLVLFGAEIILVIGLVIISHVPLLGIIISCGLFPFLGLGFLALHIVAILKALKGEMLRLPFLSEIADGWR